MRLILIGTKFYQTHLAVTPNKVTGDIQSSVNVLSGKEKHTLFHNLECATTVQTQAHRSVLPVLILNQEIQLRTNMISSDTSF